MSNNQCMPILELMAQLKLDPAKKILFVEGHRDLVFWRKYAPIGDRINCVVYSASMLHITDEYEGGEKGKLLKLVEKLEGHDILKRIKIFADADNDSLLGKKHPNNVVITDYRDLESYAFNEDVLTEVVHTGLAKINLSIIVVMKAIEKLCLPIASLRLLSDKYEYRLPFQETFKENKRRKFITVRKEENAIDFDRLVVALLQNAGISLSKKNEIYEKFDEATKQLTNLDARKVLHGKDWTFFLAHLCGVSQDMIEPLIFLGIKYDLLDLNHNISSVKQYVLGQSAILPNTAVSL